ncbi:MAG: hypothetical protein H7844_13060 [Nitrospirae bacterium YQR-1]
MAETNVKIVIEATPKGFDKLQQNFKSSIDSITNFSKQIKTADNELSNAFQKLNVPYTSKCI